MHWNVCVCVYVGNCVYVWGCVCIFLIVYMSITECVWVRVCMCVCLWMFICRLLNVWICVCVCVCVCVSVCVWNGGSLFLWARRLKRCGKVLEDLNTFLTPLQRSSRYPAVTQRYGWQQSLLYRGGNTLASGNWAIILQYDILHTVNIPWRNPYSDPLETKAWKW